MTLEQLKEKAHSLPMEPGVYLMQDKTGSVIYVGKAKRLRNRVSQYFVDSVSHSFKTRKMVSAIDHFDVIVAASEFEALVLECSLIKRHMPKYNILLKDDKGYPYLRLDMRDAYPVLSICGKVSDDGAEYFGPFGGRYVTQQLVDSIRLAFHLPGCSKKFPRDIDKERPCLNFHMKNCDGWCRSVKSSMEYREIMKQVSCVLQGKYRQVAERFRDEMEAAAENLEFERAAAFRDRMNAIENLGKKQLVTAAAMSDRDVIGYYQSETKACFAVLHYIDGNLLDKDYEILPSSDDPAEALSSLVKQYYISRNCAPKEILLPYAMDDADLFSDLLLQRIGKRVHIRTPQRGDNVRLVSLACKNAQEEAERITTKGEKAAGAVMALQQLLKLEQYPKRMESFDISHIAGTDIVASMVVFVDGKPAKKDYRRFKIEGLSNQDDYLSMEQVLRRRFSRYLDLDEKFSDKPDLLLIDGGTAHANVARSVLKTLKLDIPVYGMVKDHRHRTRSLVTPEGDEISIQGNPSVFGLIGRMQEETHRFAITYHRNLRSKRLRESELNVIPGIGAARKAALLKHFKSIAAIRKASMDQLNEILPETVAAAVYAYFRQNEGENDQ